MENENQPLDPPLPSAPKGPLSGKLTIIEVFIINAGKLFANPNEIDKWCILRDNLGGDSSGNPNGNKPEKLDSGVFDSSLVLWTSKLTQGDINKGFKVRLDAVTIDQPVPSELLTSNLITAGGNGILAQTRIYIPPELDYKEKYTLYFWLIDPFGASKQIVIDPFLKSNTKSTYSLILNCLKNSLTENMKGLDDIKASLADKLK
jgi:hypothetical protein